MTDENKKIREERQNTNNSLTLIPKSEKYTEYMLDLLLKLPRTEKFSIGTEFKTVLYKMTENIVFLSKVPMEDRFKFSVKIDSLIQIQRMYLRIMKNNRWIDEKKFKIAINMLGEIGKINGGLLKYYAKNYKK